MKEAFSSIEYLGERQVQKWKWAVNLNDLKWRIKSLWPWSSIRLFKRFLCNFYFTTLPLIWPVKFGININCTWSRWAKHLDLRAQRTVRENLSIEKGPLRLKNTHFWAIRLTKLLLGHCGSFKVIVMGQFVWIETKTRSISIDFVLTVSNSENQIFLYPLLSQSESIISLIDCTLNLWPWSSIWAADLSLRSILHLVEKWFSWLHVELRPKSDGDLAFGLFLDRTDTPGQLNHGLGPMFPVRWTLTSITVLAATCKIILSIFSRNQTV